MNNINTEKPTKLEEIKESIYQKLIADFGEIPEEVKNNQYEARIEERRERFEDRANAATARSNAAYQASGDAVKGIPLGQPIFIGHHSERGHRRALERSDNGMRRSIQEQKKSEYYAGRAAAVGSAGIDSTDTPAGRVSKMKYGQLVRFVCVRHKVEGRTILGCTNGPTGLTPFEVPGTVRVRYRCPERGTLGEIQLPVARVTVVRQIEQLELF